MNFIDWKKIFQNIIFSDQAAFNGGKLSKPCCVTCKPEEEYYRIVSYQNLKNKPQT